MRELQFIPTFGSIAKHKLGQTCINSCIPGFFTYEVDIIILCINDRQDSMRIIKQILHIRKIMDHLANIWLKSPLFYYL